MTSKINADLESTDTYQRYKKLILGCTQISEKEEQEIINSYGLKDEYLKYTKIKPNEFLKKLEDATVLFLNKKIRQTKDLYFKTEYDVIMDLYNDKKLTKEKYIVEMKAVQYIQEITRDKADL